MPVALPALSLAVAAPLPGASAPLSANLGVTDAPTADAVSPEDASFAGMLAAMGAAVAPPTQPIAVAPPASGDAEAGEPSDGPTGGAKLAPATSQAMLQLAAMPDGATPDLAVVDGGATACAGVLMPETLGGETLTDPAEQTAADLPEAVARAGLLPETPRPAAPKPTAPARADKGERTESGEVMPTLDSKSPDRSIEPRPAAGAKPATDTPVERVAAPEEQTGGLEPASEPAAGADPTPIAAPGKAADAAATIAAAASPAAARASAETTAALAAHIVKRLDGQNTRFDVLLTPEGLGRVGVTVHIGRDGAVSAAFSFDQPQAAAQVSARSEELRQSLLQAGFDVSRDAFSFSGGDRGQERQQAFDDRQPARGAFGALFDDGSAESAAPSALPTYGRSLRLGLDLRV